MTTEVTRCHYEVLGVSPHATAEEIRRAYKAKALAFHPDRQPDSPASPTDERKRQFQEVSNAYDVLKDEKSRREYDLSRALATGSSSGHGRRYAPAPYFSQSANVRRTTEVDPRTGAQYTVEEDDRGNRCTTFFYSSSSDPSHRGGGATSATYATRAFVSHGGGARQPPADPRVPVDPFHQMHRMMEEMHLQQQRMMSGMMFGGPSLFDADAMFMGGGGGHGAVRGQAMDPFAPMFGHAGVRGRRPMDGMFFESFF